MRERPILFSAPMVRAILDGRKTQTRRVAKEFMERKVGNRVLPDVADAVHPDGSGRGFIGWYGQGPFTAEDTARRYPGDHGFHCPYGQPGDRLWVKEAWRTQVDFHDAQNPAQMCGAENLLYDADADWSLNKTVGRARSALHMPKWASRLTLEVVSVRVERLQDISEADAIAEDITEVFDGPETLYLKHAPTKDAQTRYGTAVRAFAALWDSINAKRGHSWDSNPWVWVVEFRRIEP